MSVFPKEIFRAILAVSTGEEEGFYLAVLPEVVYQVAQLNLLHPHVRSVDFLPFGGSYHVTDAYVVVDQEVFALLDGGIGVLKLEVKPKNPVQDGPEHAVGAAVTKINIPFQQFTTGKPWRRQRAHNEFCGMLQVKGRVGMGVEKGKICHTAKLAICAGKRYMTFSTSA